MALLGLRTQTKGDVSNNSFSHIKQLHLLLETSQSVENLPHMLTHLTLGSQFNRNIDHLHIHTLTHLSLGGEFNQPVDNLPSSITHLTLGGVFNLRVDYLPNLLHTLHFGSKFDQPLDHLPNFLVNLVLPHAKHPLDHLPLSLKQLRCAVVLCEIDYLPPLTQLAISNLQEDVLIDNLPTSLTSLYIGGRKFNAAVDNLPPHLLHLEIWGIEFNQPLDKLPETLTHLRFMPGDYYSHSNCFLLPNLTHLEIDIPPNLPVVGTLPKTVKYLALRAHEVPPQYIPVSTQILYLMCTSQVDFSRLTSLRVLGLRDYLYTLKHLPESLMYMEISIFRYPPTIISLPKSLLKLNFFAHNPQDHLTCEIYSQNRTC